MIRISYYPNVEMLTPSQVKDSYWSLASELEQLRIAHEAKKAKMTPQERAASDKAIYAKHYQVLKLGLHYHEAHIALSRSAESVALYAEQAIIARKSEEKKPFGIF